MKTTEINKLVENFDHLTLDDKEYAIDVLKKQIIDDRRFSIAKMAKKTLSNHIKGLTKNGTVKDLYKDLECD